MVKIYAPNGSFTGRVAGVAFADGEGELREKDVGEERYEHLKEWFGRKGYGVGKKDDTEAAKVSEESHKALEDHSRDELRDLARQHAIVGGSSMSKDDLVSALREAGVSEGSHGPRT